MIRDNSREDYIKNHEILNSIENWKQKKRWSFISPNDLWSILKKEEKITQIVDVRQPELDYVGGHIRNSINIEHEVFLTRTSLVKVVKMYGRKKNFVLHCMYSQCRGLKCLQAYRTFVEEIVDLYYQNLKSTLREVFVVSASLTLTPQFVFDVMAQNIYVLRGGFHAWINYFYSMKEVNYFVTGFEEKEWDIRNVGNNLKLKHMSDWG